MKHYLYLNWQSAKLALLKILRQPFGDLLTLLMLSLALALPLSLPCHQQRARLGGRLSATPQVTLFMELSAEEADLAAVTSTLTHHPKVKSYSFVSKGRALADMEKRNGLPGLTDGLDSNPCPTPSSSRQRRWSRANWRCCKRAFRPAHGGASPV